MLNTLFQAKTPQMLGLDIGTRYVKALLLEKKGEQLHVNAMACEPILGDAFAEREIKDFDAVSNAIRKIKHNLKLKVKDVAVAVSGAAALTKVVQMPSGQTDLELEGQIELEADSLIPYPLEDVYLDFEVLGVNNSDSEKNDILLSVAHKNIVDSRITLLRELEFEPKVMDMEGYALGNSLVQFISGEPEKIHCCFCVGASQLQLTVIQGNRVIYSKEFPFGVDKLISDLCLLHGLDKITAAKQLHSNELPESWKFDTYPQFLGNLQQHINRALQLYQNASNAPLPEQLLLCGGASAIEGLVDDLSSDLGKSIKLFNPLDSMILSEDIKSSSLFGSQFAIAAGLAIRSLDPCHI
ncbi:type IV pilus biogenesis protein PilM [Paraneptunicella aestuarii]|uniref:type IV pilus biogenesis protein PilM n=1 Tax=Paraneptunicella aestuarii TaxID=2831148 RepID=UPI002FCA1CA1